MSSSSVGLVRGMYDDWNRGDFDSLIARLHPEFEFKTAQLFSDTERAYTGREGARELIETFTAAWESLRIEVNSIEDLGDRFLCLLTFHGEGRGSGVSVSVPYAHLIVVREGAIARVQGFGAWDEARRAAGIST